jgi:hypothetical protein
MVGDESFDAEKSNARYGGSPTVLLMDNAQRPLERLPPDSRTRLHETQ